MDIEEPQQGGRPIAWTGTDGVEDPFGSDRRLASIAVSVFDGREGSRGARHLADRGDGRVRHRRVVDGDGRGRRRGAVPWAPLHSAWNKLMRVCNGNGGNNRQRKAGKQQAEWLGVVSINLT